MDSDGTVTEIIEQVVSHAVERDFPEARRLLSSIDPQTVADERKQFLSTIWSPSNKRTTRPLIKAKRKEPGKQLRLQVFRRDKFTCRYAHCQRRTIYTPVLRELSLLFPDLIPYHRNWKLDASHILYWVYSTSIEHKLSFPHGGDSAEDNLITACYCCNDAKSYLHLDDLAWEITEPSTSGWDGLERFLIPLRQIESPYREKRITNRSSRKSLSGKEQIAPIDPASLASGSLIRARLPGKKTARAYRVDAIFRAPIAIQDEAVTTLNDETIVTLREMWRTDADRTWIVSKRFQTFPLCALSNVTELSRTAPQPGHMKASSPLGSEA